MNAYLGARGRSHDHSGDIISETFLRLVRRTAGQGADDKLRVWVFRAGHNLSVDLYRSERRWYRSNETDPYGVVRMRVDPALNPEERFL